MEFHRAKNEAEILGSLPRGLQHYKCVTQDSQVLDCSIRFLTVLCVTLDLHPHSVQMSADHLTPRRSLRGSWPRGLLPDSVLLVLGDRVEMHGPLPREERTLQKFLRTFTWKPGPESGLDCLICAIFAHHWEGGQPLMRCTA